MFRLTQEMEKMGMSKLTVAALIGPESDGCVVARGVDERHGFYLSRLVKGPNLTASSWTLALSRKILGFLGKRVVDMARVLDTY